MCLCFVSDEHNLQSCVRWLVHVFHWPGCGYVNNCGTRGQLQNVWQTGDKNREAWLLRHTTQVSITQVVSTGIKEKHLQNITIEVDDTKMKPSLGRAMEPNSVSRKWCCGFNYLVSSEQWSTVSQVLRWATMIQITAHLYEIVISKCWTEDSSAQKGNQHVLLWFGDNMRCITSHIKATGANKGKHSWIYIYVKYFKLMAIVIGRTLEALVRVRVLGFNLGLGSGWSL